MQYLAYLLIVCTLWAGFVIGISFVAQSAKFGAAGLRRDVALSVGRRIFRAMHWVEAVLACTCVLLALGAGGRVSGMIGAAVLILVVQVGVLMPRLSRRVDQVMAGRKLPKSVDHILFAVLETGKVALLLACTFFLV